MPIDSIIARKSLGVLMHPTCIPGGRVCGTFGRGAKEWISNLHKHGIVYGDLTPSYIELDDKGYLCLSDFS